MRHIFCSEWTSGWVVFPLSVSSSEADKQCVHLDPSPLKLCLPHLFSSFGTKVVLPQSTFKALPVLFETKDGKAREKVKDLLVRESKPLG